MVYRCEYECDLFVLFFLFKQKTAYEMRISDLSSDVCSSDLPSVRDLKPARTPIAALHIFLEQWWDSNGHTSPIDRAGSPRIRIPRQGGLRHEDCGPR